MSERKMKIAVVELGARHDEVFPVWLHLAEKNGYAIDFFVSPIHKARDIFSLLDLPRPRWFLTISQESGKSAMSRLFQLLATVFLRLRALWLLNTNYDVVIANSVDIGHYYRSFLRFIRKPMLVMLHNGHALVSNSELRPLRDRHNSAVVVLSKHIRDYLKKYEITSYPIHPSLHLSAGSFDGFEKHATTFCVQGYINFHRRNYDSLLSAAYKLKQNNVFCNFKIIGRLGRSSRTMQNKIEELGVSDYFTFVGDAESYLEYYQAISSCRFLLVLVDDSRMIYRPFFEDKCTSSLGASLGLDVIPVANRRLAEVYDIVECSVLYESDDVYSGIVTALSYRDDKIESLVNSMRRTRQKFCDESDKEFYNAIQSAIGC
jgi:glycosyltransferase involved in cell wall biosynthesis